MKAYSLLALTSFFALAACGPKNVSDLVAREISLRKNSSGIVGGKEVAPEKHRSLVKIVDGFDRICTGTLIAEDIVLTAAHCVNRGGDLEISFAADPKVKIMSQELRPHEDYNIAATGSVTKMKNGHLNDIGLILLSKPAPKSAVFASLPAASISAETVKVQAVGYGRTGGEEDDAGTLRAVNLKAQVRREDPKHFFFDQTVGKGACMGDSGGPIFTYEEKQPVIVGVVNGADDVDLYFGYPVGDLCRYTGVATQVGAHLAWIKKNIAALKGPSQEQTSTFEKGVDTSQAFCRKPFPSNAQMKVELEALTHQEGAKEKMAVGGPVLRDEHPRLLEAYRYLVTYKKYEMGKYKIDDVIDFWNLFEKSKCDKALCAAQTVFGEEEGLLQLYVAAKYGVVLSHLGFDRLKPPAAADQKEFDAYFKVRPWKREELGPYLQALTMLPEGLQLPFTRMTHAGIVNPVNANVLSNGVIQFYSSIDSLSDSQKEQTTFHELAHNYGSAFGLDTSKEWWDAAGWVQEGETFKNIRPEEFITAYAKGNFFEDFAESVTYYRYYPHKLKAKSPARYEYIKKTLFAGKEFLSEEHCQ